MAAIAVNFCSNPFWLAVVAGVAVLLAFVLKEIRNAPLVNDNEQPIHPESAEDDLSRCTDENGYETQMPESFDYIH